ncbi:cadherin-like beta sandwich domain-containing protein [Clostridium weizhouense]|uniref:Cadherin-like beta sandwich domain-containing protein n=1 Tax=Clostridium weizhouense TaxID=2859781 RepID=A0ABS7ANS7_9CLOT|nr:cadherin-like beta sandwich domain-containing protein [Clostridium weizhouense]MBW6410313.1 cadherin-like beta sandwich domain-containing protein [Clostridium weizhouense]
MKAYFKRFISQLLVLALIVATVQIGNTKGVKAVDLDLGFTVEAGGSIVDINKSGSNYFTDEIDMSVSTINIKSSDTSYYNIESVTSSDSGVKIATSTTNGVTSAKIAVSKYNDFNATIKVKDLGTKEVKSYTVRFRFKEENAEIFKFNKIVINASGHGENVNLDLDYSANTDEYNLANLDETLDTVKVSIVDENGKPITTGVKITMDGKTGTFKLSGGDNEINISRTVNGRTKIFKLVISKKGSATLKSLTGVTLSPTFKSDEFDYTATVPTATTSITLRPTATDNSSTIRVNGSIVNSGSNSQPIKLKEGKNTITVRVTTKDGQSNVYSIEVTRTEAPRSSYLKSLKLSTGSLMPSFNKEIFEYTGTVDNKVTAVTVTPTAEYATSTIKVNGKSVANGGTTRFISLDQGSNEIEVVVTDAKGDSSTYTLNITRRYGKDNVRLGSLKTSEGTLSPKFDPETYLYTVKVDRATSKIKVTFAAQNDKATIKIDGKEYASAQQSDYIDLKIGANLINIEVVAEDKKTTTSYKLSVIRDKISAINEWVLSGDDWTFYDANGMQVKNSWVIYDNKWYFINVSGYKESNGWLYESGNWYYLDKDGVMQTGWIKDNGYWYYFQGDGKMKGTGWGQYDKQWYMFNENGMMQTGWMLRDGYWYFLQDNGSMKKGWQYYDKNWYYLNDDGTMRNGWLFTGKEFYYLDYHGRMITGWQEIAGKWYYFDYNGRMKTGNLFLDGKWYLLDSDGSLVR